MNTPQSQNEISPMPNRTAISAALISLVLFALFVFTQLGSFTLFASGAAGLVAIIFGILALKQGESRALNITAITIGSVFLLLTAGILIFALIFVGAIAI